MPAWTAQQAREMAARSVEVRANKPKPEPGQPPVVNGSDGAYVRLRVAQVRKQIQSLNRKLEEESDPMRLDRLVNAIYRLTELERVLSGRPLPGQFKPVAVRLTRPSAEPLR